MTSIDIYLDDNYSLKLFVTINNDSAPYKPEGEVVVDIEKRTIMFSTHIVEYNIKFDDIRIERIAKKYINIKTNDND